MRNLKFKDADGSSSEHLELEEIADFLQGRLAKEDRRRFIQHIALCGECLNLLTETAHALSSVREPSTEGALPPKRRYYIAPRWLALAATAAVLLALGSLYRRPQSFAITELVEPLAARHGVAGAIWEGENIRNEEGAATEGFEALQFFVGAHLVGFQAAVEAGDPSAAADAAQRVAIHVREGVFLQAEERSFRQAYRELESRKVPTSRYARLIEETHGSIEESFSGVHFDFGKWTQAGYIAARTGSREWFERRKNRRFLSYLLRLDEKDIDPEARKALEEIHQVWDRGELRPAELAVLAGRFEAVLERYQRLSEQDTFFPEE